MRSHLWHRENAQKVGAMISMLEEEAKCKKFLGALPWKKPVTSGMGSHFIFPRADWETKWKSWQEGDYATLIVPSALGKVVPTLQATPPVGAPPTLNKRSPPCLSAAPRQAVV